MMKSSAFLINVARAAIVDGDALYAALANRKIAGAAFDVFWDEPADPNDRLLKLDNFVLTPLLQAGLLNQHMQLQKTIFWSYLSGVTHYIDASPYTELKPCIRVHSNIAP
jgi:D-3-phosphoglycerate dehydrogenase